MLSVQEAAERLGVSGSRVRALLKNGQLEGYKVGNSWAILESSVAMREHSKCRPGRPRSERAAERDLPLRNATDDVADDAAEAHRIYADAKRVLAGCYDAAFLDQADTPEEQAFWIRVADFFLQQRQRELVSDGVF